VFERDWTRLHAERSMQLGTREGGGRGGATWSFCGSGLAPTLLTLENRNYNMGDHKFYRLLLNI
jgi:hypothetical protein